MRRIVMALMLVSANCYGGTVCHWFEHGQEYFSDSTPSDENAFGSHFRGGMVTCGGVTVSVSSEGAATEQANAEGVAQSEQERRLHQLQRVEMEALRGSESVSHEVNAENARIAQLQRDHPNHLIAGVPLATTVPQAAPSNPNSMATYEKLRQEYGQ